MLECGPDAYMSTPSLIVRPGQPCNIVYEIRITSILKVGKSVQMVYYQKCPFGHHLCPDFTHNPLCHKSKGLMTVPLIFSFHKKI